MAEHVTKSQDTVLRGRDQQETTLRTRNLLYEGPQETLRSHRGPGASTSWPTQVNEAVQTHTTRGQTGMRLQSFEMHNRAGAAITVGIGFRWQNDIWEAGAYDNSVTNQYTRSEDLQDRTAIALGDTTNTSDGFVIFSERKWDWLSINVTTATDDNAENGTIGCSYTDEAGTAWITVSGGTDLQGIVDSITTSASIELTDDEHVFVWNPPHDWGKTAGTLGGNFPADMYGFRIVNTVVSDLVAAVVTGMEIGSMKTSGEALADNGLWENEQMSWVDFDADGVVALFETAAPGNMVDFEASPAG